MIKAIFFDAGGVLILNNRGEAMINKAVIDFINTHKSEFIFGVLSSTSLPLQNILESYKIGSLFTIVQTSGESKEDKDDKKFFTKAVARVGIEPHEAIMVDNDADFVAAAQRAGLQTVLYAVDIDLENAVNKIIKRSRSLPS